MKTARKILVVLFAFFMILTTAGCGAIKEDLFGVWEYTDTSTGMSAVYEFRDDGTGTYTVNSGGNEVVYELKYNSEGNHLLFTITNSDIYTDDDLFDIQFKLKGTDKMIVKDSTGRDLTFVRK